METQTSAPQPSKTILATDLDGTFLGGTEEARHQFYSHINAHRDRMVLVFVTGRDLPFVRELCAAEGFPAPDYVIGDVGTSVVHWPSEAPVAAVQEPIARRWNNAGPQVEAMLSGTRGIRPQTPKRPYRVSYYYEPDTFDRTALTKVEEAGFDWILSADTYFDVLPKGINKGSTLLSFVETLGLNSTHVVTAGDTLNDLALFETGLSSIMVGNAEPALREKAAHLDNVYKAQGHGVAGIWEGLRSVHLDPSGFTDS